MARSAPLVAPHARAETLFHGSAFELARLREQIKPFRLYWYPRLCSTNDQAAALRKRGELFAPAIVLTGHQMAGRGRGTNTWWSSDGSLTVTFVLPVDSQIAPHQLPLIAGLAARNAAVELTGDARIQLKWPNDLLYGWRKLGGLLCERVLKADLIGLGLNVNLDPRRAPKNLRDRIVSLSQIKGESLDVTHVLSTVTSHLRLTLARAASHPVVALLREYDAHHALIGRAVTVAGNDGRISGRCEGLDDIGRLLLRSRSRKHYIIAGEVQVRGD